MVSVIDSNVDRRIILKLILEKYDGMIGLDSSGSGYELAEDSYEHGNEPSVSIRYWEILE
jgi:hypothetical protein